MRGEVKGRMVGDMAYMAGQALDSPVNDGWR